MLAFATALFSLAALAVAQDTTINVQVGAETTSPGGVFQFNPSVINATVGSVITFNFSGSPGNHSVSQSTFANPCSPLAGGFSSGFVFVPAGTTGEVPTWNLTIETTDPLWFFCAQRAPAPHCYQGMVGGINVNQTRFEAFSSAAASFLPLFQASSTVGPAVPSPALSGSGAVASVGPGPLTGSFSGAATPSGTQAVSTGSSGASGSSGSGSSGAAPSPTTSSPSAAGMGAVVSLGAVFVAMLSSVVVLM